MTRLKDWFPVSKNKMNTPKKNGINSPETKRLFTLLQSFLDPIASAAGLTLRPFSITTFTAMQLAGIAVGSAGFKELPAESQTLQLAALLVIQTAPLSDLGPALREANGDFEKFYWGFVFERAASIPLEGMLSLEGQLDGEMPAIEAAMVETQNPSGDNGEKPPGN